VKARVPSLAEILVDQPYDFNFFQAVRLLGLILPDRPGVGDDAKPAEEIVRFMVRQSLEFAASAIHDIDIDADPARMVVAFFGLTGVQGVLPHHYTEHIIGRAVYKDHAMAAFFDLFNHRLISLFYRAWEKHRMPVLYQSALVRQNGPDLFTRHLFDLVGMGTPGFLGRMKVRDEGLLRYAGLFVQYPRSAASLRALLRDYFRIPVEIDEFRGEWHLLEEDDRCNLKDADRRNELGVGAVAGDSIWDPQSRFRIRLGPLKLVRFLEFLPETAAVKELTDLVRLFVGEVLQFEWQAVLKADEVPWSRLGDESPAGPRLGWCSWLKTDEFAVNAEDAVFVNGSA
jgi:type VI secretion system protein ImpH